MLNSNCFETNVSGMWFICTEWLEDHYVDNLRWIFERPWLTIFAGEVTWYLTQCIKGFTYISWISNSSTLSHALLLTIFGQNKFAIRLKRDA